jgi:ribonuclease P protein component
MKGERFARPARLLKRAEFDAVFASRLRHTSRFFIAHICENPVGHPRLGFAISARSTPTSVERNRIKRRMREAFRRQYTQLGAIDIVIRANSGTAAIEKSIMHTDIQKLWKRLIDLNLQAHKGTMPRADFGLIDCTSAAHDSLSTHSQQKD